MEGQVRSEKSRDMLDEKLTELTLFAKKLCPEARVEVNTLRYEDEDGRIKIFPPPSLSEDQEEKIEEAVAEKCVEIFEETGLFILCAVFDSLE